MLDALKQDDPTVDATAVQSIYQIDTRAVAEEIILRAHLIRRMRREFATGSASEEPPVGIQTKCS
jgi:hypothetical protein